MGKAKLHHSDIQNRDYTYKELSKITGKQYKSITINLNKYGWTVDEILGLVKRIDPRCKPYHSDIQNRDYTTRELSEITGKSISSINTNLHKEGWTVDELLGLVKHVNHKFIIHHSDIQNRDYTSIELSEITGVHYSTINSRLNNFRWTVDELLGLIPRLSNYNKKCIKKYTFINNLKVLSKAYSTDVTDFYECIDIESNQTFIKSKEELIELWQNRNT